MCNPIRFFYHNIDNSIRIKEYSQNPCPGFRFHTVKLLPTKYLLSTLRNVSVIKSPELIVFVISCILSRLCKKTGWGGGLQKAL